MINNETGHFAGLIEFKNNIKYLVIFNLMADTAPHPLIIYLYS